jgi:YfiH family protein
MVKSEKILGGWTQTEGLLTHDKLTALGLRHGFTTRQLGNMKDPEKRRAAARQIGLNDPMTLKQVHGTQIHLASSQSQGQEGDGWLLGVPGVSVGVYVADCVPLFVWSADGRAAGVFHAGWRGTAAGMARAAVAAFDRSFGIAAAQLFAATGPHIGACCYRVGAEFEQHFPSTSLIRKDEQLHLDLDGETRRQLLEAGVPENHLSLSAPCTASHPDEFFSFRREKQDSRLLAILSLDRWPS